ncbi:MAG: bifunctional phosphoribosyl-AMP cyclohydrolase/phosphoribosyl-ATP diphosphatase HisIE [Bacillota bacterium]|nr:bifunctional phosphoribosyl-AMP cyclohydrolase/phosphoribosyl-ATP diphosphatase HisIE [Bacillota bacterium]
MEFDAQVLAKLNFDEHGLIPAVVQEASTGEVLMVAYMNRESLQKSLATGQTWFWSRSRQELWWKGATSGHFQEVQEILADCDYDTLLVRVDQVGGIACHEGLPSCFHHPLTEPLPEILRRAEARLAAKPSAASSEPHPATSHTPSEVLDELCRLIEDRKAVPDPNSYTCRLLNAGVDRICRKVGEEATEVVVAAKNGSRDELTAEAADLIYHLLVLLAANDVAWENVLEELDRRRRAGHGGDGYGGERLKNAP